MKARTLLMVGSMALLIACSDSSNNNSTLNIPVEQSEVLLTELVDDIFMASENSEPVEINDLNVVDNADEYSFSYLTGGE